MIEVMKTVKSEIESLGYLVDFVLPDFKKQQKDTTILMLNYKILKHEGDGCGRSVDTVQVNVVAISKQHDSGDEWYIENHETLKNIGDHFVTLTKENSFNGITVTSYVFNELGVDSAMRYVNEIQMNVICHQ
ncbi:MAG: hypothetical protein ACK5LC_14420 [Coprobacillaceae bacterium]